MYKAGIGEVVTWAKDWQNVFVRAKEIGCSTFVQELVERGLKESAHFLDRAMKLLEDAEVYGIEPEVRELLSYGNLEGTEKLLLEKHREKEFLDVKAELQKRIDSLSSDCRLQQEALLHVLCMQDFGSNGYNTVLLRLNRSLEKAEV